MPDPASDDLLLSPAACRALTDLLPPAAAFAAWEFVNGPLRDEPYRVGAPLREPFAGLWRARRGEYRVRYEIDEQRRLVRVLDIDHRRDAYVFAKLQVASRAEAVARARDAGLGASSSAPRSAQAEPQQPG